MGSNTDLELPVARLRGALMILQHSLSLPHLLVLLTIRLRQGLSVNELAECLNIPQQSASRHVALLTGRYQTEVSSPFPEPLISQRINETDPRKRALYLSDAGESLIERLMDLLILGKQGI